MARRIDDASRLWLKGLKYGQDTTKIANDINKASRALSQHVTQMHENLKSFVSALEKMEVRKKSSIMARRILGWLKLLFNALASLFALGSSLSPFLSSVVPGISLIAPAASTLWNAVAAFCGEASGMFRSDTLFHAGAIHIPTSRNARRERIGEHRVRDCIP
jgi:prophage DNA circulation protein